MRRVVVTGIGIISPVGNNRETFFNALTEGRHGIDFIKNFDASALKAKIAAEVKGFDPFTYMGKSEVRRSDRFVQFALAAAEEAMADCGALDLPPERIGVYVGSGIGGLSTFYNESVKYHTSGQSAVSPYFISMMIANMAAGAISIKHKLMGPSLPAVTACATSSHTIGEAFRAVKHGYADAVVAGGSEASIAPLAVAGFANCLALYTGEDKDSASVPFDKRRSGFVMGEGAGILVLEEYENAKRRGAKMYGEITGYGNTMDAFHVTAPRDDADGAARAVRAALSEACVSEQDAGQTYVNAHGTSTGLNDKTETLALKKVFGTHANDLLISSTKSMTGHCLGAAGALEAAAALLALQTGVIPPTAGYREPDPDCDLNYVPNKAVSKPIAYALSNSFGFGGHNACLCFSRI